MPSGKTQTLLTTRSATLRNPNDPLSLATSTDVFSINARRYTTTFEAATRRRLTTSPAGRTELAMLDGRGRVVSAQVSGLAPISIQYGANGYVESVATGARLYRVAYNARRELTSITDPALRTTSFVYDTVGRLTANIFPDGRSTAFGYDLNGNVTAITPPGRATHRFTYTPVNLDDSYTPPALAAAGGTHFTYDRDRQLTAILYPGAEEVDIRQDAGGRPTAVIAPHGTYSLTYSDAMLTSISAPDDSRLDFAYDGSLMTSVTWSGTVNGTIEYSYDNDFRVVSENGVPFTFDADGFLTKAGNLTLTRNTQNGLLTGTSLQAVTDAYTYNEFGEVTGYTAANNAAPLLSVTYGRDDLGRISSETEQTSTTAAARVFEYDTAGRLVRVRKGGVAVAEYDYDANGNRTAHSYVGGSASATYDAQDRLLTYDRTTYTYSPRGDLQTATTGGVTTNYGYDVFGNLRRVVIGDRTIEYVVDGQHRRVGKKVNGSFVAGWLYGDQLRVVAELDSTGAVVSRFVYGSRDSSPDYLERDGMMFRLLADRVGSPRLIVNAFTGAVVQRIDYDEFGRVVADTNPGFQPFGFAGGLYDRDTGFVRFGSRDYDPQTGRWTTKDQIGFESGHGNLYGYATSDPINFIDRDGRAAAALGAGGVAIVTGIVAIVGAEYLRQHPEMMRQLATSIAALADALHESGKSTTAPGRGRPGTREKYDVPECPLTDVPGAYKEWRPPQDECGPGGAMWLWVEQSPTWKDRIIRSIIATHYCANK
jgi:RHS repeat-associated protein